MSSEDLPACHANALSQPAVTNGVGSSLDLVHVTVKELCCLTTSTRYRIVGDFEWSLKLANVL